MKKIFVLLLATAMIFALAACGATPNGTDNNNTQDDHQAETPDASYEAPQITELYNEDFDYTDGVGIERDPYQVRRRKGSAEHSNPERNESHDHRTRRRTSLQILME